MAPGPGAPKGNEVEAFQNEAVGSPTLDETQPLLPADGLALVAGDLGLVGFGKGCLIPLNIHPRVAVPQLHRLLLELNKPTSDIIQLPLQVFDSLVVHMEDLGKVGCGGTSQLEEQHG